MKKKKPDAAKPDSLSPLVQQVSLAELRLLSSRTLLSVPAGEKPPGELHQKINVQTGRGRIGEADHLLCVLTFALSAEGATPEQPQVFLIEAQFALAYTFLSLDGVPDDLLQEFGQRNALHNAWPYWREFVQTMTSRMGLPALKVPLMRPGDLNFKREVHGTSKAPQAQHRKARKRRS